MNDILNDRFEVKENMSDYRFHKILIKVIYYSYFLYFYFENLIRETILNPKLMN